MAFSLRLKQQIRFFLSFSTAKILTECLLVQEIELGTEYHDSIFAPESQPQEYQQPYVRGRTANHIIGVENGTKHGHTRGFWG